MDHDAFVTLAARTAKTFTRRASLSGLGMVTIASLTQPGPARAGKVGKRVKKTCKRQIGECEESVSNLCAQAPSESDQDLCRSTLLPCCGSFNGCHANAAIACLVTGILSQPLPTERRRVLGRG